MTGPGRPRGGERTGAAQENDITRRARAAAKARAAKDAAEREAAGELDGPADRRPPDDRLAPPTLTGPGEPGRSDRLGRPAPEFPAAPEAADRSVMERELRGLLEAAGARPDEQVLRRQLDAWYRSPTGTHHLTPEQSLAFEQAHARAMDRAMAHVERLSRAGTVGLGTRQLIEAATDLDAELLAEGTGPRLRGEIARTLLAMHRELDRRIRVAPVDDQGLPRLAGVEWKRGDPIAGITEAIGPFGNIDIWTAESLAAPPESGRAADEKSERVAPDRHESAPLDDRERAERQRVATPSDGMGFAFGAEWPDAEEWARFWRTNGPHLQIGLMGDRDVHLVVEASASAPGTDAANLRLGRRRAENTKALLISHGIPEDRIILINYGEGPARAAGWPSGRDNAEHRIGRITLSGGSTPRDRPAEPERPEPKTSIPEEFTPPERYSTPLEEAQRLARSPDEYFEKAKGLFRPRGYGAALRELAKQAIMLIPKTMMETGDFHNWIAEMRGGKSADQKLWDVAPPSPLRTLKGSTAFRGVVEYQLKLGGYDPRTMYRAYLVHWFRRGVR